MKIAKVAQIEVSLSGTRVVVEADGAPPVYLETDQADSLINGLQTAVREAKIKKYGKRRPRLKSSDPHPPGS